jgi:PIN domain nuclease of toxin-antitoxin system
VRVTENNGGLEQSKAVSRSTIRVGGNLYLTRRKPRFWKVVTELRLLLDTVTFIWAIDSPEDLSRKALTALRGTEAILQVSAISFSEIAIKNAKGKLNLGREDVLAGLADLKARILPYTSEHACRLFTLPLHHTDPFDRQIIAQAVAEDIPVVTPDEMFKLYRTLKVIW